MLADGWLGLNWGDVPTWVLSILTGCAFLIAAVTYRKSVSDSQRDQANAVSVWVGEEQRVEGGLLHRLTHCKNTLHVKNGTSATVYSVTVYYRKSGRQEPEFRSPYYDDNFRVLGRWISLGPGEEREADFERNKPADPQIPWLYFRDANGVDWIRDYRARLKRRNYWLMRYISEANYMDHRRPRALLRWLLIYVGMTVFGVRHWAYERTQRPKSAADAIKDPVQTNDPQVMVTDSSPSGGVEADASSQPDAVKMSGEHNSPSGNPTPRGDP
jgi:hypothetical protein